MDAGPGHGIAPDPHKEGRGGMVDQVLVQIQTLVDIIVGGRGKAGGNPAGEQRQPAGRRRGVRPPGALGRGAQLASGLDP